MEKPRDSRLTLPAEWIKGVDYDDLDYFELEDLRNWADSLWECVIVPSKASGNPSSQHFCCNAVTTRTATTKAGHPESVSIWQFLKNNKIKSAKDYYAWLVEDVHRRIKEDLPTCLPTLNSMHHGPNQPVVFIQSGDLEKEFLKNYLTKVEEQRDQMRIKFEKSQDEVDQLRKEINALKKKGKKSSGKDSEAGSMAPMISKRRPNTNDSDYFFRTPVGKRSMEKSAFRKS